MEPARGYYNNDQWEKVIEKKEIPPQKNKHSFSFRDLKKHEYILVLAAFLIVMSPFIGLLTWSFSIALLVFGLGGAMFFLGSILIPTKIKEFSKQDERHH